MNYDENNIKKILEDTRCRIINSLWVVAKMYSRLGHHNHAHCIFRIANSYDLGISGPLIHRLDYCRNMAKIEENEDLLKALDRLTLIQSEIESQEVPSKYYTYFYDLFKLYSRIGLKDMADILANRYEFHIGQTPKQIPSSDKEIVEKNNLKATDFKSLIDGVFKNLNKQKPTPLIHAIEHLCNRYLINIQPEKFTTAHAVELDKLIAETNQFITKWICYSELDTKQLNQYSSVNDVKKPDNDPKQYAEVLLGLAVNLCQIYNHALLPQFLYHFAMRKKELNNQYWIYTLIESCIESVNFNDPVNFIRSFKEATNFLSQDNDVDIPENKLFKLFKGAIIISERLIERIVFPIARSNFIESMSPHVEFATFNLAKLNTAQDKESWIFRGANLLKARAITGLRVELPSRSELEEKNDWLELRKLFIEENELMIKEKGDFRDEDVLYQGEQNIRQRKYELFLKIDKWGRGGCSPRALKNIIDPHKHKKISVISFFISEKKLLVTGISNHTEAVWFEIYDISRDVDDLIKSCFDDIEFQDNNNLKEAFTILISPIMKHIKGAELLYIIPDAKLCNLPFHALIDEKEQYLIEKYEIAYVPSPLILWRLLKTDMPIYEESIIVGCSGEDIDWKNKQTELSLLGMTVNTPEESLQLADSYYTRKVLYIIGHGYLPTKGHPFDAYLELKDSKGNLLKITARNLLAWGPKSNFVFLNSCSLGKSYRYGEDIYGFPFSIMGAANASGLVAAIPIDIDFAHHFAVTVFKSLKNGTCDRTTAIAKTIRECIRSPQKPEWKLPSYWAPYFFYGDFRPLSL